MSQSKEVQREQARLRKRKQRDKEGVTSNSVTGQGVTRIEFIQKELNDPYLIQGIEAASLRFNDRDARYERAYRYYIWKKGERVDLAIPYALVEDRTRLEKIYQSLKDFGQEKNVFYGYPSLMPFDVVGEYLEVTK